MKKEFNKDYAQYYDLLYENKDYVRESNYVFNLIRKYNVEAKTILDLGCGTGKHAQILSKSFEIVGVDRSAEMIKVAKQNENHQLTFITSSIENLDLNRKFDVVISLFHVMSYQTTNEELNAAFNCASKHLKKGGVFIFDCWYGPAVLNEKPSIRFKKVENNQIEVIRLTKPQLLANLNLVNVNFEIIVKNKKTNICNSFKEQHRMRYLFQPEIDYFFNGANLIPENYLQWMEMDKKPNLNSWYIVAIGRKK